MTLSLNNIFVNMTNKNSDIKMVDGFLRSTLANKKQSKRCSLDDNTFGSEFNLEFCIDEQMKDVKEYKE